MKKHTVGIDIGTYEIKVVVAEASNERGVLPKIISYGQAESKGMRHGYILNQADVIRSIKKAIAQAQKSLGQKIEEVFVSIGGIGLSSIISEGQIIISRADSEITELDIEKVAEDCQNKIPSQNILNKKVIHAIPIEYRIDDKLVLGNPIGMKGVKLQAKMLFVTCLVPHINQIVNALEMADIDIIDAVASPLAASTVTLSKTERIAGCVLVNIGSETVSMVVYENDFPIMVEVFPIGSNDITNDIALGLKISLEEAEKLKKEQDKIPKDSPIPKKKLDEIVIARVSDIFDLVDNQLKKIGKSGLLPAGIILTGGGSGIINIQDIAKASLKLPSKIAKITNNKSSNSENKENVFSNLKIKDSSWAVAYGLCVLGFNNDYFNQYYDTQKNNFIKKLLKNIAKWFQKFMP
jgi:cell division protein FtsA